MKKVSKYVISATVLTIGMCLAGCSEEEITAPADTVIEMHDTIDDAQNALNAFKDASQDKDNQGLEALGETPDATTAPVVKPNGYVFTYQGLDMTIDSDYAPFLSVLGQPAKYYEVPSCAFDGKDKIYPYGSVDVYTYPQGEKDYIGYIEFRDDTVSTQEGACLYMSKQEITDIYGFDYSEKMGAYCYKLDNMELRFIFEDDQCVSIKYSTLVLDAEE